MPERKPKPHEILIPRRFDNEALMAGWASNLGYSYFMRATGRIAYINKSSSILHVDETEYSISDYPQFGAE